MLFGLRHFGHFNIGSGKLESLVQVVFYSNISGETLGSKYGRKTLDPALGCALDNVRHLIL
jgi:hypothetical protein